MCIPLNQKQFRTWVWVANAYGHSGTYLNDIRKSKDVLDMSDVKDMLLMIATAIMRFASTDPSDMQMPSVVGIPTDWKTSELWFRFDNLYVRIKSRYAVSEQEYTHSLSISDVGYHESKDVHSDSPIKLAVESGITDIGGETYHYVRIILKDDDDNIAKEFYLLLEEVASFAYGSDFTASTVNCVD